MISSFFTHTIETEVLSNYQCTKKIHTFYPTYYWSTHNYHQYIMNSLLTTNWIFLYCVICEGVIFWLVVCFLFRRIPCSSFFYYNDHCWSWPVVNIPNKVMRQLFRGIHVHVMLLDWLVKVETPRNILKEEP